LQENKIIVHYPPRVELLQNLLLTSRCIAKEKKTFIFSDAILFPLFLNNNKDTRRSGKYCISLLLLRAPSLLVVPVFWSQAIVRVEPLFVTLHQLSVLRTVQLSASVEIVTLFVPPDASKDRLLGDTLRLVVPD
jgi:hypothetical protein